LKEKARRGAQKEEYPGPSGKSLGKAMKGSNYPRNTKKGGPANGGGKRRVEKKKKVKIALGGEGKNHRE